jgi:hypothetical protein
MSCTGGAGAAGDERDAHAAHAGDARWVQQGQLPHDDRAPVVPDEDGLVDAELVEDADEVAGEVEDVVGLDRLRAARAAVAPLVRREDPVAGSGQRRDLAPPRVGELGEPVGEDDGGPLALVDHVEVDPVGGDRALRHRRSPRRGLQERLTARSRPRRDGVVVGVRQHVRSPRDVLRVGRQLCGRGHQVPEAGEAASEDRVGLGGGEEPGHRRRRVADAPRTGRRRACPSPPTPRTTARPPARTRPRRPGPGPGRHRGGRPRRRRAARPGPWRASSPGRRAGSCTCGRRRWRGSRGPWARRRRRRSGGGG